MVLTVLINGALGLAATITCCYIVVDIERQIINGDANYPYVEFMAEALDSVGGAVTLASGVIVIGISMLYLINRDVTQLISQGMSINAIAAASRQGWAFARDG